MSESMKNVPLSPLVQQMQEEYAELATRHDALVKFLDGRTVILPRVELDDLYAQRDAMYLYKIILERRLIRHGGQ